MRTMLIIVLSAIAFQLYSQNENTGEYIAVIGKADGTYTPDMVTMEFEIRVVEKKQKDAVRKLNEQTSKLIYKLIKLGVKENLIKLSNYYSNESYDYSGGKPKNVGYEASQQFEYEIKLNKEKFYDFVDSISKANIQNLNFTYHMSLSDSLRAEVKNDLISKATLEAKKLSQTIAEVSKVKLGSIYSIEYTDNRYNLYGKIVPPPPPVLDYYDANCDAPKISCNLSIKGIDLRQEIRIVYKIISEH